MKKLHLFSLLFASQFGFSQTSISLFPGASEYKVINACQTEPNVSGKFIVKYVDSCEASGYTGFDGSYNYIFPSQLENIEPTIKEVMRIINFYKKKYNLGEGISFFNPTNCYYNMGAGWVFDQEYFDLHQELDYKEMYFRLSTGLINIYALYELIPGQLDIYFFFNIQGIGITVMRK